MNNATLVQDIPRAFCWTRMGEESGERLDRIVKRKELERCANDGAFVWGIGNAVGSAIRRLIAEEPCPEVLFSPIRSAASTIDANPAGVLLWLDYVGPGGSAVPLPHGSFVTSRSGTANSDAKRAHYALFCGSESPLRTEKRGTIAFQQLRNLQSQRPVGFSQVTAVVSQEPECANEQGLQYDVVLRAQLQYPFCVRLVNSVLLTKDDLQAVEIAADSGSTDSWAATVWLIKEKYRAQASRAIYGGPLFAAAT